MGTFHRDSIITRGQEGKGRGRVEKVFLEVQLVQSIIYSSLTTFLVSKASFRHNLSGVPSTISKLHVEVFDVNLWCFCIARCFAS